MQTSFNGVWVPIVTPFQGDGIDHPALERLARHVAKAGVSGLVVGATTGEGALLRPGEQEALLRSLRAAVPGLPLVLGINDAATAAAVARSRELAALKPAGLLVTPPPYLRPSQEGIRRHFEAVVEAADLPVLVYDIPYRTGAHIELETLRQLARDARVVGIKECGGDDERLLRLVEETPLRVLSGDDARNFVALCLGAHGVIAASAHVRPEWHVRMGELVREGRIAEARRIAAALRPIVAGLFAEPSPAPLKALLAEQGWCSPQLRLPFVPAGAALRERLAREWRRLEAMAL